MASSANHRVAAVTPEPQLVMTGLPRSTPPAAKRSLIFSGAISRPPSISSLTGTFFAPGM
jgi:hypothetical protein